MSCLWLYNTKREITYTVAMTQLINNNNNDNNNNNNDGEQNYLHKKFKKIATTELILTIEPKKNININTSEPTKKKIRKRTSENRQKTRSRSPWKKNQQSRKNGYVCPYCRLSCAKPSVLQKHIRVHTNERLYLCMPYGFVFKTKSNFYKHCRSRTQNRRW